MEHFVSGSKTIFVLNGKVLPGAGYMTQRKWFETQGQEKLKCTVKEDVVTYFDNIRKYIKKQYHVSYQKMSKSDVITLTLHIHLNSTIQNKEVLKPINWKVLDIKVKHRKMKQISEKFKSLFRHVRVKYVKKILEAVMFENDEVEQKNSQKSAKHRYLNENYQKNFENKIKKKSDFCKGKVEITATEKHRLNKPESWNITNTTNYGQKTIKNNPLMKIGEPVLINPNSFVNIE